MKKTFFVLLFIISAVFLFSALINPAISFLAKRQLENVFKDSRVSIGACRLNPARQLGFSDIKIQNEAYEFVIGEAVAEYRIPSIFTARIMKFSLKEAKISINLLQDSICFMKIFIIFLKLECCFFKSRITPTTESDYIKILLFSY